MDRAKKAVPCNCLIINKLIFLWTAFFIELFKRYVSLFEKLSTYINNSNIYTLISYGNLITNLSLKL